MIRRFLHPCPASCGHHDPPAIYRDVSFADQESPDQAHLIAVIEPRLAPGHRLLHVGIGASGVARRLGARVDWVEGITVVPSEVDAAPVLPNYRVSIVNKYGPGLRALAGPFDVVIDNNPGSFACCREHFSAMMDTYARLLTPGGCLVTEARGARWSQVGGISLRWPHWKAEGRSRELTAEKLHPTVWALRRR